MLQRRSINRSALKTYAPKARNEFIAGVTARAAKFGITKDRAVEAMHQGDLVIIGAEAFSRGVGERRQKLLHRIALHGFEQTMEEVAYTWFNRFLAIRFMELHGYLEHGYRVLSHPGDKELPEILEHAEHLELPGLDQAIVIDLKLDGTKDAELYRLLLIAQCNALHRAMPFLFEKIDDETELLLPDNLLHTDSLIRKLVSAIDEADWQEIEIIGWLYQFYISEKKDEVIGKVVKSEDIPAATQLFTPNWIVKYMVQNALGAQWLATYPDSPLKAEMQYYVEPAEQADEVKRQLAEITPKELNPEELTLIDPACGSGHILVEAYELFKAIYLERGYRLRDIPRLILEKNLYGLDIDDRAAQMAGFALLMKARADDRRILSSESAPVMHVMAVQDSRGLDAQRLAQTLMPRGRFELLPSSDLLPDTLAQPTLSAEQPSPVQAGTIAALLDLFAEGKTFGSLIKVPNKIANALPALRTLIQPEERDDIFQREAKSTLQPLVELAESLAKHYDAVVANPPYMGRKYYNDRLQEYVDSQYKSAKGDLYGAFIIRNLQFADKDAWVSMITIPNWLFLSTYEALREQVVTVFSLQSLIHNGRGVWGADFGSCSFVIRARSALKYRGVYRRLFDKQGQVQSLDEIETAFFSKPDIVKEASTFDELPGRPIAYWLSDNMLRAFHVGTPLGDLVPARQGLATADNNRFVRAFYEVDVSKIGFGFESRSSASESKRKWFPYNKGGDFRKWYGNQEFVVNWKDDGHDIRNFTDTSGKVRSRPQNTDYYFRSSVSWSDITSSSSAFRYFPPGFIYDVTGMSAFAENEEIAFEALAFCNSKVASELTRAINPTVHFQIGNYNVLPFVLGNSTSEIVHLARRCVELSRRDWEAQETSWTFARNPLLLDGIIAQTLAASFSKLESSWAEQVSTLAQHERSLNAIFIERYGLSDELDPDVQMSEVSLRANPTFKFGEETPIFERTARMRTDAISELVSFAVGCMMGRYGLAEPGLIYAYAGNEGFDRSRYGEFVPDDDGIVPITEIEWFDDDAAVRFGEFLKAAWSPETLRENLHFVAESLANNGGSDPQDAIRSYFAKAFFKDHLKTYKRRPIYWLFSSGKLKAFECLVYLHRYNESTLSRIRMEYVVPLQSRMAARIDQLGDDVASASSSAVRTKAQKEKDLLARQLEELRAFDEELRHYADQRIALDLDEGVKVNYGKFGNLLAERKAVTGEK